MKIKEYLNETTSGSISASYEVPYADPKGKGYYRTTIPPVKRNMTNLPLDKNRKPIVKKEDWLKISKVK